MTLLDVTTDETLLVALDFEPAIPCERPAHKSGGCDGPVDELAKWRILVAHTKMGCAWFPILTCDSGLRKAQRFLDELFTVPPPYDRSVISCEVCGNVCASPAEFLQIIGEV